MIHFYQQNSLKECFREVDTTLQTPYKQPEDISTANSTPNTTPSTAEKCVEMFLRGFWFSFKLQTGFIFFRLEQTGAISWCGRAGEGLK